MKTVRRHELQTNTLADWTGKAIEDARPYGKVIVGTLLAILIVVVAYVVMSQRSQRGQERGWSAYFQAIDSENPADLEAVVQAYPSKSPGRWAALILADRQLADGLSQLLQDQAASTQALRDAIDNYKLAAEEPDDMVRQRAQLGLAKSHESLRDLDKARDAYQALLDQWPEGVFATVATARLADLDSQSTKDFYDWLARQKPSAIPPGPGEPGARPPFDLDSFIHPPVDGAGDGSGESDGASSFSSLLEDGESAPAQDSPPGDGGIVLPQVGEPDEDEITPPGDGTGTGVIDDGLSTPTDDAGAGDAPADEPAADDESGDEGSSDEPTTDPANEGASAADTDADPE